MSTNAGSDGKQSSHIFVDSFFASMVSQVALLFCGIWASTCDMERNQYGRGFAQLRCKFEAAFNFEKYCGEYVLISLRGAQSSNPGGASALIQSRNIACEAS